MKTSIIILSILLSFHAQAQQEAFVSIYLDDLPQIFETTPSLERIYQKKDSVSIEVMQIDGQKLYKEKFPKFGEALHCSFSIPLDQVRLIEFMGPSFSFHWLLSPGDSLEVQVDAARPPGLNTSMLSTSQYPKAVELLKGLQAQIGPYISQKAAMVNVSDVLFQKQYELEPIYKEIVESHENGIQFYDQQIAPAHLPASLKEELKILAYFGGSTAYGWISFTQMFSPDVYERYAELLRQSKSFKAPFNKELYWLKYTPYEMSVQTLFLNYTDRPARTKAILEQFEGKLMYKLLARNISYACMHAQHRAERTKIYDIILDAKANCPYPEILDTLDACCFEAADLAKYRIQADWLFENVQQEQVSLQKWKGKVILVDIWTTWCGPCKREMQHIPTLLEIFEGEPFEVVALSFDKDKKKWYDYIESHEADYSHLHVAKAVDTLHDLLKVNSYPRYLLIDKEGKLAEAYAYRPSNPALIEQIEALLEE